MRIVIAALAAACVLTGCGSSDDDAKSPETTADADVATKTEPLTEAQLTGALLTLDDLPAGFVEDSTFTGDDDEDDSADFEGTPECEALINALDADGTDSAATAEAGFAAGEMGPFVMESIESYGADADLSTKLAAIETAIEACPEVTMPLDETTSMKLSLATTPFAAVGDEVLAIKMSGEESSLGLSFAFQFAFVRVGQNALTLGGISMDGSEIAATELESLATTAVDKLKAVS